MAKSKILQKTLHGVLHLFSETGTEGGYWAFQDKRFIKPNTTRFACKICHQYWDKAQNPSGIKKSIVKIKNECLTNQHKFELAGKEDWGWKGLHILYNGDRLTILDKANPMYIVWKGVIKHRVHKLFTKDVFEYWIHTEQKGIDLEVWAKWFFENYPAELVKNPNPKSIRE